MKAGTNTNERERAKCLRKTHTHLDSMILRSSVRQLSLRNISLRIAPSVLYLKQMCHTVHVPLNCSIWILKGEKACGCWGLHCSRGVVDVSQRSIVVYANLDELVAVASLVPAVVAGGRGGVVVVLVGLLWG